MTKKKTMNDTIRALKKVPFEQVRDDALKDNYEWADPLGPTKEDFEKHLENHGWTMKEFRKIDMDRGFKRLFGDVK